MNSASAQDAPATNVVLLTSFGAKGDLRAVAGLTFAAKSREVQASPGTFAPTDVGRTVVGISVGANGGPVSVVSQIVAVAQGGATATMLDEASASLREARGGIGTDNADSLQRCWDASAARGFVCWIPAGQYLFAARSLVMRSHMSVEGGAPELSILVCAPSVRDCVSLDEGPVQFVSMARLGLSGAEGDLPPPPSNALAQRGFHLVAHGEGHGAGGGLWQSTLAHVEVSGFWGDEFVLQGGVGEFSHPNQFLFLEDLELQAARGSPGVGPPPDSYRLRIIGQNAQIAVSGGQIHGSIGSQLGNGVLIDGAGVVRFEGVTCEWLDVCLDLRSASAVRFTDGWIENVKRVATLGQGGVHGFTLDHSYLANSCYDLHAHGGWCVKLGSAKADTGISFDHNDLVWGTAPPDTVVLAPPGAVVEAEATLENGVLRDASAGRLSVRAPSRAGAPLRSSLTGNDGAPRKASLVTAFLAPGAALTTHLVWSPQPFVSPNFTATCVLYGAPSAMRLEGIVRQTAEGVDVAVRNLDPRSPQRATVHCLGVD